MGKIGVESSNTMTTPEPRVAPMRRVSSKVSGVASSCGVTSAPAAPPSRTVWMVRPAGAPPASSIRSDRRAPNGISYRPGRWIAPDRQNSRVPAESAVPRARYAAAPSTTMSSTLTRVSTLLTQVGLPNRPTSTGNGGLLRGSPRKPSSELKSAVSSPQM